VPPEQPLPGQPQGPAAAESLAAGAAAGFAAGFGLGLGFGFGRAGAWSWLRRRSGSRRRRVCEGLRGVHWCELEIAAQAIGAAVCFGSPPRQAPAASRATAMSIVLLI
jgi:hypothetical protein